MEHGRGCEKQSQFGQGSGISNLARDPSPWASAPNKPNLGKSHFEDKCCADKDLQCIGRGENPRKTKPISRSGAPRRCLYYGLRIADSEGLRPATPGLRGPVVQTNPIGRSELCKTKPIPPQGRRPGLLHQTNPICPAPTGMGAGWRGRRWGRSRQTNLISPQAAGRASVVWEKSYGEYRLPRGPAKQSQFPRGQHWPQAGRAGCTNKANLPDGAGRDRA